MQRVVDWSDARAYDRLAPLDEARDDGGVMWCVRLYDRPFHSEPFDSVPIQSIPFDSVARSQLQRELAAGRVLGGWRTPRCDFRPTFKASPEWRNRRFPETQTTRHSDIQMSQS